MFRTRSATRSRSATRRGARLVVPTISYLHPGLLGQGGALGRIGQSQVPQLAFAGGQPAADLAQRLGPSQVTEQHGHELSPATEPASVALGPVLGDRLFKLLAGKQLQHLAENAGYSYHGGGGPLRFTSRNANRSRVLPRRSQPNLDKSGAEQTDIQVSAVSAWVAYAEGKKAEAVKMMRSAADREDASEKHVAMENRLWPMRELLGDLLLAMHESAPALKEYETSLQAARNRYRSFYGAAKAAEQLGDREMATSYYQKLLTLCIHADTERPEQAEANKYLVQK